MRRRTVLIGGVSALSVTAGCLGIFDSSDGDSDGPANTVRAYWQAIFNLNVEEANTYLHEESQIEEVSEPSSSENQEVNARIDNVTVIEQTESSAEVKITISGELLQEGGRSTVDVRYELRRTDGEWLIYDRISDNNGGGPSPPSSTWDMTEQTNGSGAVDSVIFEHNGGDTIQTENLEFNVGNIAVTSPDENRQISTGSRLVVPFEDSDSSINASTEISLIWSGADTRQIIATYYLENPTTGSPTDTFRLESP